MPVSKNGNTIKKYYPNKIFFFYIKMTNRCNLKCTICSQEAHQKELDYLSYEEICKGIDTILPDIVHLGISGGEPFVRYEDTVKIFQKYSLLIPGKVNIFTNGTIPIKDFNDFINAKGEKPLFKVSIDGIEEDHDKIRGKGRYQQTINFIDLLEKNGFPFTIQSVIDESYIENDGEKLINFYNSFKKYKFLTLHDCTPPRVCGRFATKEHFDRFLNTVQQYLDIFAKHNINHHICEYCPLRDEEYIDYYTEISIDEQGYVAPICLVGHDRFFPYEEYSQNKYYEYLNNYIKSIDMKKVPQYICPLKYKEGTNIHVG